MPIKQLKQRATTSWKENKTLPKKNIIKRGKNSSISDFSNKSWKKDDKHFVFLKSKLFKYLALSFLGLAVLGFLAGFIFILIISRDLPNPDQLIDRQVAQSTIIYDRSGEHILYEISGDERRTLVDINEIPDYVKHAVISIEDKNFYNHKGFSLFAMLRTAVTNVIYRRSAGGSTMTQQFVKNAVLSNEKTIIRKVKELIISYRLEKKFSKDEILQMYLNEIPYGSNAYGVEAASQKYFGKSIREASVAEAAVLAAIVQVPTRYSPYGPNKDLLLGRKDYVLRLMAEQGYISKEERDLALEEEIIFTGGETNITAPHFVMYIRDILASKYGEIMIEQGGLKIYTTLDYEKQKIAENVIREKTENYPNTYNANNASLVAIDPKTGQILTMVGSRNYFDDSIHGQVNISTRNRQPGSSIKPLVYAALFEKGYTPNTILYDVTTNFSSDPDNTYEPRNYNLSESGPINIRKSLAGSLNIPAVKALYLVGLNQTIDLLEDFGYSTFSQRDRFGLAFVLGGAEVKLLEHTNAFSVFATEGDIREISGILRVEDSSGEIIEEYKENKKSVLSQQSARMINEILSDNNARSFIFGERSHLVLSGRQAAVKTGTTNDFHDAWTVGYTPSLVAGVWVGNSNNEKMSGRADGSVVAAPIWNEFMKQALEGSDVEQFIKPGDYETGVMVLDGITPTQVIEIDTITGFPADQFSDPLSINRIEIPIHHSILHYVDKNNPLSGQPKKPESDPQYDLWEEAIINWNQRTSTSSEYQLLNEYNDSKKEENNPYFEILGLNEGDTINDNSLPLTISSQAKLGTSLINYFINNNLLSTRVVDGDGYYDEILNLNNLPNGFHSLRVRVCDSYNNCSDKIININLSIDNNIVSNKKNIVKIESPQSGIAASSIDFPMNVSVSVSIPERVHRLILTTSGGGDNNENYVISDNIAYLNTFNITLVDKGNYIIKAEVRDYNGDTIQSETINIMVN